MRNVEIKISVSVQEWVRNSEIATIIESRLNIHPWPFGRFVVTDVETIEPESSPGMTKEM